MDLRTIAEYALTFVAAGCVVVAVRVLAKSGSPTLAGMLFMFPVISMVSLSFLMLAGTPIARVQQVALSGLFGIPSLSAFLVVFAILAKRTHGAAALGVALLVWIVVAAGVVQIRARVMPGEAPKDGAEK